MLMNMAFANTLFVEPLDKVTFTLLFQEPLSTTLLFIISTSLLASILSIKENVAGDKVRYDNNKASDKITSGVIDEAVDNWLDKQTSNGMKLCGGETRASIALLILVHPQEGSVPVG